MILLSLSALVLGAGLQMQAADCCRCSCFGACD